MARNRYVKGAHNVICDSTGFKRKNYECRLRWDGLFVIKDDWEPRQTQDFVKSVPDMKPVPLSRPEGTDKFVEIGEITPEDL